MSREETTTGARVLVVDVGTGKTREETLSAQITRDFVGARGLGAYYLFKNLEPGTDPLDPRNPLIFGAGPLAGTMAPGGARASLVTKSPQTGIYLFSITGGRLGPALKRSGHDLVVLTGRAERPVYVELDGDRAWVRDAEHLWGLDTQATQEVLRLELRDDEAAITCIGPAGERLVPSANLINERRALGRGGAGAVMGSKNVKALVVRWGEEVPYLADPTAFRAAARTAVRELKAHPFTNGPLKTFGSVSTVALAANAGILPADNWQRTASPEETELLMGDELRGRYLVKDVPCGDPCPSRCSKITVVREGPYAGSMTEGPEYETVYSLGTACGVFDLATIIHADRLCDLYGIDSISVGVTIAFAMECAQRGLLSEEETGGPLRFGDGEAMVRLVRDTAFREGLGARLALGTRALAAEIGGGADDFAMHAKGMELGGYDPRGAKGMALVYACGPRGGCHHAGGYTVGVELGNPDIDRFADTGKARLTLGTRDRRAGYADAAGTCAFLIVGLQDGTVADLLSTASGFDYSPAELYLAGARINALERVINVREGLRPEDDALPARLIRESVPEGPAAGQKVNLALMRSEFYQESGLDPETGLPTRETLDRLGLTWVLDDSAVAGLKG